MAVTPSSIIPILWLIFIAYWIISAVGSKKSMRTGVWWKGAVIRILIAVILILLLNGKNFQKFAGPYYGAGVSPALGYVGVILAALGIGFAIYARWHLGKNWGMPRTIKENPGLVTSGPYAYVRHPIYAGVLLATFGSALAGGFLWLVIFICYSVYFIYSATAEEKNMTAQFPKEYPAYKNRTKMLIPFIF